MTFTYKVALLKDHKLIWFHKLKLSSWKKSDRKSFEILFQQKGVIFVNVYHMELRNTADADDILSSSISLTVYLNELKNIRQ